MPDQRSHSQAIVMGASIAGLWAARVLSDHVAEVLVLERDHLPEAAEFRSGTPQARQYHVMLLRGLQLMDELFPGMRQELIAAGALTFDITGAVAVRSGSRWLEQFPSNHHLVGCSRVLLEAIMRRRLRNIASIRFLEHVEVLGLTTNQERSSITGVRIRHLDEQMPSATAETLLQADLVVDALGRRSPMPEWLQALGYQAPQETVVDSFLGYVTRRYRKPDTIRRNWPIILISPEPPHNARGGLVFPEEADTWVVMMAGANKDYPPVDEAGFRDYAASLGPEFFSVVTEGEAISKAYGYRGTDSRWRHYERLARWPERLVILGDAFCGFNPIYGQGMTVAALSAQALGAELHKAQGQFDGMAQRTIQAIAKTTEGAWLLATSADMQWPATIGGEHIKGPLGRFARWYISELLHAMADDRVLRLAFLDVNHLLKPATRLFAPPLMHRVLRSALLRHRPKPFSVG